MTSVATARFVSAFPHESLPILIWITFTIDSTKKTQPMTDPAAEPIIPNLRTFRLMWARKASSTSLLLSRLMASFRPCATRLEKRKKLKETTSKTNSLFATSGPASHLSTRLCWPGVVRERPTKTAMVKRELTLTRPSRATTWTLVVDRLASEPVRLYGSFA